MFLFQATARLAVHAAFTSAYVRLESHQPRRFLAKNKQMENSAGFKSLWMEWLGRLEDLGDLVSITGTF